MSYNSTPSLPRKSHNVRLCVLRERAEAPGMRHCVKLCLLELQLLGFVEGLAIKSSEQNADLLLHSCIIVCIREPFVEH